MLNIVSESEFNVNNSELCVIKFSAIWCSPCKKMNPIIEELESEFKNVVNFVSIDVDNVPSIAQKYKIMTLPTILILKNGKEVNRTIGISLIDNLRKIIKNVSV